MRRRNVHSVWLSETCTSRFWLQREAWIRASLRDHCLVETHPPTPLSTVHSSATEQPGQEESFHDLEKALRAAGVDMFRVWNGPSSSHARGKTAHKGVRRITLRQCFITRHWAMTCITVTQQARSAECSARRKRSSFGIASDQYERGAYTYVGRLSIWRPQFGCGQRTGRHPLSSSFALLLQQQLYQVLQPSRLNVWSYDNTCSAVRAAASGRSRI